MIRTTFTLGSVLAIGLMAVGYTRFVEIVMTASHFDERAAREASEAAPVIVLSLYFTYVVSLLTAIFQGLRNFLVPSVASAMGSAVGVLILLLTEETLGASAIAFGYLANVISVSTILWFILARDGRFLCFGWSRFDNATKVLKLVPPLLLNQLAAAIVMLYPNYAASALDGGDLTAIMYARRIFEILPVLIIVPAVTALGPMLSDLLANSTADKAESRLQQISAVLYAALVPVTVFILIYADDLMALAYGRGAYGAERVGFTADNLRLYMLGLIALGSNAVITRALVATQNVKVAYVSVAFSVTPAVFLPLFTEMGVSNIGRLGVASGYTAYLLLIHQPLGYWIWRKTYGQFSLRRQFTCIIRLGIISAVAAVTSFLVTYLCSASTIGHVLIAGLVFSCAYTAIHYFLATEEYMLLKTALRRNYVNA